ncbi:MAG TPA: hypothetical protein VLH80_07345 [Nitrospiraceae bacterium]|nr:hypothetical protein [Nitrospiraceae bacterium]
MPVKRPILDFPRDARGLYMQPSLREYQDPKLQTLEQHNRDRAAAKADYADRVSGNPHTVDPAGRYNCGRCNQAEGTNCLIMDMSMLPTGKVDREAGSCGKYEITCAGDAEMKLHRESPVTLRYGIATNGHRFGCEVCPLKVKAHVPDSMGRTLWCGWWYARVFPNACCADNAAPTRKIKYPAKAYGY